MRTAINYLLANQNYKNHPMKTRRLTVFILGILLGLIPAAISYILIRERTPAISCIGKVKVGEVGDISYFSNSPTISMVDTEVSNQQVYLEFNNVKTMNDAIGKRVMLTGKFEYITLDNGELISLLTVNNIDQVKTSLDARRDFMCFISEKYRKQKNLKQ
jgi:hypothetical protein